jgi:hypothetical protein
VSQRFASAYLRALRNEVAINDVIHHLDLPAKMREGYLRFLCPRCSEFHTATNPKTNLARCFRCRLNFNPIDLVMAVESCSFVDALKILDPLLARRKRGSRDKEPGPSETQRGRRGTI